MDAPPPQENCLPFVEINGILQEAGVLVPTIFAKNVEEGFLLLSDFGSTTFLQAIEQPISEKTHALYLSACQTLTNIQKAPRAQQLPTYSAEKLLQEMMLFPDWYVGQHCQHTLTDTEKNSLSVVFNQLIDRALSQPQVMVHRDYHSRNLMITTPSEAFQLGVIDFQDALLGPITYDLVSLLRDAYVSWDESIQLDLAIRYWEMAKKQGLPVNTDFSIFWQDFEWMGLQRHLKVLGIFTRLFYRDGKSQYLNDIPLVMSYTRSVAKRYRVFSPLLQLLDKLENVSHQTAYTF
jgi:aminoglycoside/choline kinase family phosphotransferase